MSARTPARLWSTVCLMALSLSAFGADETSDIYNLFGPFAVKSNGAGQLSSAVYSMSVDTTGTLAVSYLAPRTHCSSLRMHFLLDGSPKAVSAQVAPGGRTGYVDLGPVSAGFHVVGLQAEGIAGGCNVGRLAAWEGSAEVRSTPRAREIPTAHRNGLSDLIFEVARQEDGDYFRGSGTYVTEDGIVYTYASENDAIPIDTQAPLHATYKENALRDKYSHEKRVLGRVRGIDMETIKAIAYNTDSRGEPNLPPDVVAIIEQALPLGPQYRIYRRADANMDFDGELIADTSASGVRIRAWLDAIARGEGYRPVVPVECFTFPCPTTVPPP
jgi:hypothetical protein